MHPDEDKTDADLCAIDPDDAASLDLWRASRRPTEDLDDTADDMSDDLAEGESEDRVEEFERAMQERW